jgi:hypothetical protein
MMKFLRLLPLFFLGPTLCSAQSIPAVKAKALNDSEVALPNPSSGQVLILIVGFSHKSADVIESWAKHLAADYHDNPRVAYFAMPELQGVPGLVKPMILHGMRKDVSSAEYPHFVPIYDNKPAWEKLVSFAAPDDAYLIVATPDGHPVWQSHGAYSDETYGELKKSVSAFLGEAPTSVSKP